MLRRVDLVETDVSEKHFTSTIKVSRICELGTTLAVTSNLSTLRSISSPILVTLVIEAKRSSETSTLTTATLRNIPDDGILQN
jgi:hypothetical protein